MRILTKSLMIVLLALFVAAPNALAAKDDIVIGESALITGVFGFAGGEIHEAIVDFVNWKNENGGINGRKIKHVFEDCGYKVDRSVAAFKKMRAEYDPVMYMGDSTGFMKAINQELLDADLLMSGVSYASELMDEKAYPRSFLLGPSYSDQMSILLTHAASEQPGAKVAIVHSDTGFGRDPISAAKVKAKELGLELVETITTKPGSVDVTTEVLKLRRKKPDYVLFHGYVLSPINEFMQQMRDLGLQTKFMGTNWATNEIMIKKLGPLADGFLGVMHLNFYNMEEGQGAMWDAMRAANLKSHPDKTSRPIFYVYGWFMGHIYSEVIKRTLDAGKELNADNLRASLESIQNWDSGGLASVPISFRNNSMPMAKIFRINAAKGKYEPVSDAIEIK